MLTQTTQRYWAGMLTGIVIMICLGWLKLILTGNILTDHNPYPWELGYPVFICFAGALLVFGISYWKFIWSNSPEKKNYKTEAYLVLILASVMVPFVSNDVIIYLAHGYLSNNGVDVFSHVNILSQSVWAPHINDWKDGPFVYGPINLIPSKLANYVGRENLWLTFVTYRLMMLLAGIIIIELLNRIVQKPKDLLIVVLAPAFWLHNVGHMHNDLIAMLLIITSLYFLVNKRIIIAAIFIGIAMASKVSIVIYIPFLYCYYFFTTDKNRMQKLGIICVSIVLMLLTIIGCYMIFYTGTSSIEVPFAYLAKQNANKSFAEILGEILNVLLSDQSVQSQLEVVDIKKTDPKVYWWKISKTVFNAVGLMLFVILGIIFIIKTKLKPTKEQVLELFIKFSFIFFFIYLHIFQAWYLVLIAPLIVLSTNVRLRKYFMILCCYSGVHTIMIAIARPSMLFILLPILVLVNIGLFLWQFRKNYLTIEAGNIQVT